MTDDKLRAALDEFFDAYDRTQLVHDVAYENVNDAVAALRLARRAALAASAPDEGPTYATLTSDGETTHYVTARPAVPALDVEGMRRAWPETGLDFFMPSENRWVSAVEAMDIFAREYAALQEQTDDR